MCDWIAAPVLSSASMKRRLPWNRVRARRSEIRLGRVTRRDRAARERGNAERDWWKDLLDITAFAPSRWTISSKLGTRTQVIFAAAAYGDRRASGLPNDGGTPRPACYLASFGLIDRTVVHPNR